MCWQSCDGLDDIEGGKQVAKRVRVTAEEFRAKHAANTNAASEYMVAGINRVTEAPGAKAAAAQTKMKANLVKAIDSGKWARRVKGVSLEDWKDAMINKGVGRVSEGLEGAAAKIEAFAEQLIAHENRGLEMLDGKASVTLQDSKNRMTAWFDHMVKFERK